MWIKACKLSINWCTHQFLKASAPECKIRKVLLWTIITVEAIVTALEPDNQDSQKPMCSLKLLVRSSKRKDQRPRRAPLLRTMPRSFHVPQFSLIALWKRLWTPIDSRMSIAKLTGSEIKSKNAKSFRCRALAEWSVRLPIGLEQSAQCPNVKVSSKKMSRMALSIGTIKPRQISLILIAFHSAITRTVWCMSPLLMLLSTLISRLDMRTHYPRKTSAIATWISRTYSQEIVCDEWSMTTQAHQSSKLTKKVASLISSWRKASSDSAIQHLINLNCLVQHALCRSQSKANAMQPPINGLRAILIQLVKWITLSLRWNQQFPLSASVASFSANCSSWKWC